MTECAICADLELHLFLSDDSRRPPLVHCSRGREQQQRAGGNEKRVFALCAPSLVVRHALCVCVCVLCCYLMGTHLVSNGVNGVG